MIELTKSLDRYRAIRRQASNIRLVSDRPAALQPTPTHNAALPFRRGGFASLCEALDYAARGDTGFNFFDARGRLLSSLPYRALRAQAQSFARRLIGAGVARGQRLVLVADTWPGFCVAFFGAQYAGVAAGARLGSGRPRRQGKLHRAAAPADRRRRRGRHRGARRPRRLRRRGGPRHDGGAAGRSDGALRRLAGGAGRAAAAFSRRTVLRAVLVGQHAPADRRRRPPGPADGQHRRLDHAPGSSTKTIRA